MNTVFVVPDKGVVRGDNQQDKKRAELQEEFKGEPAGIGDLNEETPRYQYDHSMHNRASHTALEYLGQGLVQYQARRSRPG